MVTSPHAEGHTPENLPIDRPVALVMGTEFSGASDFMMAHADGVARNFALVRSQAQPFVMEHQLSSLSNSVHPPLLLIR